VNTGFEQVTQVPDMQAKKVLTYPVLHLGNLQEFEKWNLSLRKYTPIDVIVLL
jgi:hypothetical protein